MAMKTMIVGAGARRYIILFTGFLLSWVLAVPAGMAQPANRPAAADSFTPVEEFSRQLDEFKRTIPELNKKIEESAGAVDRWTDVEKARKEIEELRGLVGAALG